MNHLFLYKEKIGNEINDFDYSAIKSNNVYTGNGGGISYSILNFLIILFNIP